MIAHEGTQFACFLQFNGICSLEGDGLACGFSNTVFGISPNPIGGVKLQVAESYLLGSDGSLVVFYLCFLLRIVAAAFFGVVASCFRDVFTAV